MWGVVMGQGRALMLWKGQIVIKERHCQLTTVPTFWSRCGLGRWDRKGQQWASATVSAVGKSPAAQATQKLHPASPTLTLILGPNHTMAMGQEEPWPGACMGAQFLPGQGRLHLYPMCRS